MLKELKIKNYALIEGLNLQPSSHFNTITGETGAGKSILLGALGLLLGNRADVKVLSNENEKCIVEGTFAVGAYQLQAVFEEFDLDYEPDCIIRREIAPNGKSRAFINDSPTTLDVLKNIGNRLVDIHSQHENLLINKDEYIFNIIDSYGEIITDRESFQDTLKDYRKVKRALKLLTDKKEALSEEQDYKQFLFKELETLSLQPGELKILEENLEKIDNTELIKSSLNAVSETLENDQLSVLTGLKDALLQLKNISDISEEYKTLMVRLESCYIELEDINKEALSLNEYTDYDQEEAELSKTRFSEIQNLIKKHNALDEDELISITEKLSSEVYDLENIESDIQEKEKELNLLETELNRLGTILTEARKEICFLLQPELLDIIQNLGMEQAVLEFKQTNISEPNSFGFDQYELLFSANKGVTPQPVQKVASGGEFSRLMFAVKYILAQKTNLPTLLFDEIDTGVSGEIALKMGKMMAKMAKEHQVITITHLPQVAALGDKHFHVYKDHSADKTKSVMRPLSKEERLIELAQMIGGTNYSEAALKSATELMEKQ